MRGVEAGRKLVLMIQAWVRIKRRRGRCADDLRRSGDEFHLFLFDTIQIFCGLQFTSYFIL